MKRSGLILWLLVLLFPLNVLAAQTPAAAEAPDLTAISFKNATLNEPFKPGVYDYTLTLKDPHTPPTLKDYQLRGDGHLFITYMVDEANHQTGIEATVEHENGSVIYHFTYANAVTYDKNSDNVLKQLIGEYAEVYPALEEERTQYKLYIPHDLTALRLTAVTRDVGAYCDLPSEIIVNTEQEPRLLVTVTASDGSSRIYTFHIKRSRLTTEEVRARRMQGDFSYATETLFTRHPAFLPAAAGTAGGLLLIILLIYIIKRLTVKAEDGDEPEFFAVEE